MNRVFSLNFFVKATLILVVAFAFVYFLASVNTAHAQSNEVWYLLGFGGESCGPGVSNYVLSEDYDNFNFTLGVGESGRGFNRVEVPRSIGAGNWQVAFIMSVGSGGGPQNSTRVLLERRNASCVVQQTIIDEVINIDKGVAQEYLTTPVDPGQVAFDSGDILTLTLFKNNGNQNHILRYRGAPSSGYDSRIIHPAELQAASPGINLDQTHFRWRDDVAEENEDDGWLASENSQISVKENLVRRIRFAVQNTGAEADAAEFRLEYSTATSGPWSQVGSSTSTEDWVWAESTYLNDGSLSTENTGISSGGYIFTSGEVKDAGSQTGEISFSSGMYTQLEFSITATSTALDNQEYFFRLTNAGDPIGNYSVYASALNEGPAAPTDLTQKSYRWRNDDGPEGDILGGDLLYKRVSNLSGENESPKVIEIDPINEVFYVAGFGGTTQDCTNAKCGRIEKRNMSNGSLVWSVESTSTEDFGAMELDVAGGVFYVAGGKPAEECSGNFYCWSVEKRNTSDGSLVYANTVEADMNLWMYQPALALDSVRGYLYIGSGATNFDDLNSDCNNNQDNGRCIHIKKLNESDASVVWSVTQAQNDISGGQDAVQQITVDSSGDNIYVSGWIGGSSGDVQRRNASDGSIVWHQSVPGSDFWYDHVIDETGGHIYSVGKKTSAAAECSVGSCLALEKRNLSDGSHVYTATSSYSGTYGKSLTSVDIDPANGFVYVAGRDFNLCEGGSSGDSCLHLEKRNMSDGSLVFHRTSDKETVFSGTGALKVNSGEGFLYIIPYQKGGDGCPTDTDCWRIEKRFTSDLSAAEGAATWVASENTAINAEKFVTKRVRVSVSNEGDITSDTVQYRLEYSTSTEGPWTQIDAGGAHWGMIESPFILNDGDSTTNVTPGISDPADRIFKSGEIKDSTNQTSGIFLMGTQFTEFEYSIRPLAEAVEGQTYYFRVTNAGSVLHNYTFYPEATVFEGEPPDEESDTTQAHYRWRNDDGDQRSPFGSEWDIIATSQETGWTIREGPTSVVHDNKLWVMGGSPLSSYLNDVWYSADGVDWTMATASANWNGRLLHTSVVYDGKMWVIGGQVAGGSSNWCYDENIQGVNNRCNDVWYSEDGVSWTMATSSAAWSPRSYHASVVYDGKMWVIGGSDGSGNCNGSGSSVCNDVWYSTDGVNWTMATNSPGWGRRSRPTVVVFNNEMYLMGGSSGVLNNDVWRSSDGANWTLVTSSANWSPRTAHASAVYDNRIWVLAGWQGSGAPDCSINHYDSCDDVWYSEDGVNWVEVVAPADFGERHFHVATIFNDNIYVMAGYQGSSDCSAGWACSDVWISTKGATFATEQDTSLDVAKFSTKRLRFLIANSGDLSSGGINYQIEYSTATSGPWSQVGDGSGSHWAMSNSDFINDGEQTSNVRNGITDPTGNFSFTAGQIKDVGNTTGGISLGSGRFTEIEYSISPTTNAIENQTYYFRVTNGGFPIDTYSIYGIANATAGEASEDSPTTPGTPTYSSVSTSSLTASWSASTGADYYTLERAPDESGSSGTFSFVSSTTQTSYDDSGLATSTTYWYRVMATNEFGTSSWSGESSTTTLATYTLTASSTSGGSVTDPGESTFTYDEGTVVDIVAVPDLGFEFNGWTGDTATIASTTASSTTITMNGDYNITASFTALPSTLTQTRYRWRNDDGNETGANWGASENIALSDLEKESTTRLRLQVANSGGDADPAQFRLEYATSIGGPWTQVPDSATNQHWEMAVSTHFTDGDPTTAQLTSGATDFVAGEIKDQNSETSSTTLTSDTYTELEYAIRATTNATDGETYRFRVTDAGTALDNYDNWGTVTLFEDAPATPIVGTLESSTIDTQRVGGVTLLSIIWQGEHPSNTAVHFQIAVSNDPDPAEWEFFGPNGEPDDWYGRACPQVGFGSQFGAGPNTPICVDRILTHGHRYFRYKVRLTSNEEQTETPVIDDIILIWAR